MKAMMKGSFNIFKRAILVFFLVLVPVSCSFQNAPSREVTCSSSHLTIKYRFAKPFKGIIYADGHSFDPVCSFRAPPLSDVREVTLRLPLSSCGTSVQFVPNGHSTISNKVRIQQHNILRTSDDITRNISCVILGLTESTSNSPYISKNVENPVASPKITSRLELKVGHEVLGIKLASELEVLNKQVLVFRVPNSGRYNDIHIKNCVIHRNMILGNNSLLYQLTHHSGCKNTSSDVISPFSVVNKTESGDLLAYAKIKPLKGLGKSKLFISCGAQLCRKTCRRRCTRRKLQNDILTSIATHRLSKRSIDVDIDQSTRNQSDIRNNLLKSTIKALVQTLMRKVEEPKQLNDILFEKRVLNSVEKEDSTTPEKSEDSGIPVYGVRKYKVKSTMSPRDYELTLLNSVNDDFIAGLEDYDNPPVVTIFPSSFPKAELDDENPNLKFRKALATMIAMQSKKLNAQNKAFKQRLVDIKKANSGIPESADSESSTFGFTHSDVESNTSPNDYEQTSSILAESGNIARFETSDFEELPLLTTLPNSLPENPDMTVIIASTEVLEPNLVTEDPMKSLNKSVVKGYSVNLNNNLSTELYLDYNSTLKSSCVSQLTFLAVSIVLGFIIFVLMMVCCGLTLYIRKEKKRHLIDNFLLYNFY